MEIFCWSARCNVLHRLQWQATQSTLLVYKIGKAAGNEHMDGVQYIQLNTEVQPSGCSAIYVQGKGITH